MGSILYILAIQNHIVKNVDGPMKIENMSTLKKLRKKFKSNPFAAKWLKWFKLKRTCKNKIEEYNE